MAFQMYVSSVLSAAQYKYPKLKPYLLNEVLHAMSEIINKVKP